LRRGFRRFAIRAGLALLGTALFCGGEFLPGLTFLPYVALVPWAILYMGARTEKVSPLYGLLAGYLCWIVCYRPMFGSGGWAPLAAALFFVPAWLLFPLLALPIQRLELPRSLTLPVVWVAVEWARLLTAAGHFDLFALGYSQAGFAPLVQIADVTGVYGVSFLIAAVNGLIVDAFFAFRDSAWRLRILFREPAIVVPAAAIAATVAAVIGYGDIRLSTAREVSGPRWALYAAERSVAAGSVDLVVWPGSASLDDVDRKTAQIGTMALIGGQSRMEGVPGRTQSSVLLVDAEGNVRGRYDKQILFPFLEYAPLDRAVGAVTPPVQAAYRRLIREVWGSPSTLTPGSHMTLFDLPWKNEPLPFAATIGAEIVDPALVADASRHGARFVVNLTSDDDLGRVAENQLLRVCVLRAIENRVAFVRAGDGSSAFIDPQGRLQRVPAGEVLLSTSGTTAYAASHDAFALLCVAASLWMLARALLGGRATMTPIAVPAGATT
jgi:apolipoprotein N-acyltransferase